MRPKLLFITIIFVLMCIVGVIIAQENLCEAYETELSSVVGSVCSTIGNNEVCYGNFTVNLVPQVNIPQPNFSVPGDMADLGGVQSLFLSELNLVDKTWGIAQMHLLALSPHGAQDVMLLLFGDVRVDNEVESTSTILVEASIHTNIRISPTLNGVVVGSLSPGEVAEAVGRLDDSSWVRVRVPETGGIGWILNEYIVPIDAAESLDLLSVQTNDKPYFGAMQAMRLTTGNSPVCGNLETDGLIIQTPAGAARVTLLINEVTIELIPSSELGATAFVQSNPEDGMSVTMIDGSAFVSSESGGFFIPAGSTTNIVLDNTSTPITPPSLPTTFGVGMDDTIELLDTIGNGDVPVITIVTPSTDTNTGTNTNTTSTDSNINTNTNTDTNTNSTGTGTDSNTHTDTTQTSVSTETSDESDSGGEVCTGNSCNAPGQQTGEDCFLGGSACDASSRNDRP